MKATKTFNLDESNIHALTTLADAQNKSASSILNDLLTAMSPVLMSTAQLTNRAKYLQEATQNSFKHQIDEATAKATEIQQNSLKLVRTLDKQVQNEIRRRNTLPRQ
jgi:hypothetical protein